jgi:hypothetical protein
MNIYTPKLSLIDNVVKQYTFLMHISNHASETKGFNDVRLLIIKQKKRGQMPSFLSLIYSAYLSTRTIK